MSLDKYISELLFEHDCVIIPDFGGFVCNYSSATIHLGKQLFHPPYKKISFNRNLKNNDGLLANQISLAEKISYSEANKSISSAVNQLHKELGTNKRFDFKNIGSLYAGEENTLLFEQDNEINYLPESFGFTSFHSSSIKREPLERKIERQLKDKIITPSKEKKEVVVKRRVSVVRNISIAASAIILISSFFIFTKTDVLKNVNIANLNPFAAKAEIFYQPSNNAFAYSDSVKENIGALIASVSDTSRYLNILIDGKTPIVISLKEDATTVVKKIKKEKRTQNHFHIVGGAFAVPANAQKFRGKLVLLGYDAIIIDKKNSGLQCVSYGSFATREEALQALEKIRSVQQDVWLMIN